MKFTRFFKTLTCVVIFISCASVAYSKWSRSVVTINEISIVVNLAKNKIEWQKGLTIHDSIGEYEGMLFIFPREKRRFFWASSIKMDLSIAYINSELEILEIHDIIADTTTTVASKGKAMYALEVNKGFFDRHNIRAGDKIQLKHELTFQSK